ncbi:MAG: MarC family protein [Desulfohalobiaceae bacterium]
MIEFKTIFEIALPLFLIMDPFANSTACLAILRNYTPARQRWIIFRELIIALALMLAFQFLGRMLLDVLDIQQSTLRLAGGVILFIISLKLIFPEERGSLAEYEKDPFIVPIATPFVAGPSLLAAIMLYSHRDMSTAVLLTALLLAWCATVGIMLAATALQHVLGSRGSRAAERLMGLVLILLAVKMMEEGVQLFLAAT